MLKSAKFLCCLLFVYGITLCAKGEKMKIEDYESLTYRLYSEQKWDSLLLVGERAISEGHDYFYMRARVGVAAFELQKYIKASTHFEAALDFNSNDEFVSGALYHAYLYSGRVDEARIFLSTLPASLSKTISNGARKPLIYFETGPAFSDHVAQFEASRQTGNGLYSEAYLNKNSYYLLAGTVLPIGYKFSVNAAFSTLNFNKNRRVDITFIDSLSGNYKVSQIEAYLSTSFLTGNGKFRISPAFRLVNVSMNNPLSSNDSIVQKMIGSPGTTSYNDIGFGGEISYLAPFWVTSVGLWSLRVDDSEFTQTSASVFVRPLGNLNLYTNTNVTLKTSQGSKQFIFSQLVGGKLFGKVWGEAFFTTGDFSGTGENNLQVFYNAFDKLKNRYGVRLILNVNDHLKLTVRGQVYSKEGTELFFTETGQAGIYSYNYQTLSITGGMSWNLQ
jgi:tetratricopeptide (TPR) repeat protein